MWAMLYEINWQAEQNCLNKAFKSINVTAGVEGNINAKKADMQSNTVWYKAGEYVWNITGKWSNIAWNKAGEQVKLVVRAWEQV